LGFVSVIVFKKLLFAGVLSPFLCECVLVYVVYFFLQMCCGPFYVSMFVSICYLFLFADVRWFLFLFADVRWSFYM